MDRTQPGLGEGWRLLLTRALGMGGLVGRFYRVGRGGGERGGGGVWGGDRCVFLFVFGLINARLSRAMVSSMGCWVRAETPASPLEMFFFFLFFFPATAAGFT